jgi:hypothetical protein
MTNPLPRIFQALSQNLRQVNFSLPSFTNYTDYDFRNDQALDMFEDLL